MGGDGRGGNGWGGCGEGATERFDIGDRIGDRNVFGDRNKFTLDARRAKADLGLLVSGLEGDALVAMHLLQGEGTGRIGGLRLLRLSKASKFWLHSNRQPAESEGTFCATWKRPGSNPGP